MPACPVPWEHVAEVLALGSLVDHPSPRAPPREASVAQWAALAPGQHPSPPYAGWGQGSPASRTSSTRVPLALLWGEPKKEAGGRHHGVSGARLQLDSAAFPSARLQGPALGALNPAEATLQHHRAAGAATASANPVHAWFPGDDAFRTLGRESPLLLGQPQLSTCPLRAPGAPLPEE